MFSTRLSSPSVSPDSSDEQHESNSNSSSSSNGGSQKQRQMQQHPRSASQPISMMTNSSMTTTTNNNKKTSPTSTLTNTPTTQTPTTANTLGVLSTADSSSPLLAPNLNHAGAPPRSFSAGYISSPLNPNFIGPASKTVGSRPASRGSAYLNHVGRLAVDDTAALAGNRGSMLLYRLATEDDGTLMPPPPGGPAGGGGRDSGQFGSANSRFSRYSIGTESIISFDSESKYPSSAPRGLVPYAYDPALDDKMTDEPDDDDKLHQIEEPSFGWSWRGVANFGLLILLIAALLCLFIFYPALLAIRASNRHSVNGDGNLVVNATGQAVSNL